MHINGTVYQIYDEVRITLILENPKIPTYYLQVNVNWRAKACSMMCLIFPILLLISSERNRELDIRHDS